jgi:uncharacterized protein YggE
MARKEYDVRINYSMPLAVMVVAIVVIVLVFAAFAVWHTSPTQISLIRITSSGTLTAVPSEASIYVYLNGTGATAAAAVANLSTIAGTLNQTVLPLLNGNLSNLQTLNYNVYVPGTCPNATQYYYYRPYYCIPPGGDKFYVAAETMLVNIPSTNNINGAISKIAQISGVGIGSISAKLSDSQQTALGQQALTLALANATTQAQALAGTGVQVSVINITVNSQYYYPMYASGGVVSSNVSRNQSSFFPGTAQITRSVSVVFGVKN